MKNRMKKRCMASILALVMMCLLGACGTDKADTKLYQKESKEKISADVCNALCRNSASAKYESGLGSRWQHDGTFSGCRTRSVDIGTVRGTDDDLRWR